MKPHGGEVVPEQPAKGEKAEHGLIEEAGKTTREYACAFISQIEGGIGEEPETRSMQPSIPLGDQVGGHLLLEVRSGPRRPGGLRTPRRQNM